MFRTSLASIAIAGIASAFVSLSMVTPAEARETCRFFATNGSGFSVIRSGSARTMDTACRRAKRKCKREVDRARRRHGIPRGPRTVECLRHS